MIDWQQLVWLFFRMNGRISRAAFLLGLLLANLVPLFFAYRVTLAPPESTAAAVWAVASLVLGIVSIWSLFALSVKRLHDFGRPGHFSIALVIPVVSLIALVALCVVPGDPGPNRYARDTNEPR